MKLSHLNALRALEASVRLGSFRAAAEELNVTPAAVGQQVKKLEDAIGQELLVRTHNGFVPTFLAEAAAERLTSGLQQVSDALELLNRGRDQATLSVSIVPTIAEYWLAPRLPAFWQANPGIELRLDSTSSMVDPVQSHFDFALRYGPETPEPGQSVDLFPEYLLPICVPELADRIDPSDRMNPLRGVTLLQPDRSTVDPDWLDWTRWCQVMGYSGGDFAAGPKFTYTTLALRAMFAGHGIHLAQLSIVLPALSQGRLVAPFGAGSCVRTGFPYRLVAFNSKRPNRVLDGFRDWILAEAARTREELADFVGRGAL